MTTILPATININRREGDHASIIVILPDFISVSDITDIKLQANDGFGRKLIEQNEENTNITRDAERNSITIPLELNNGTITTKGADGEHDYELQVTHNNNIQTILRGKLLITKEIIK